MITKEFEKSISQEDTPSLSPLQCVIIDVLKQDSMTRKEIARGLNIQKLIEMKLIANRSEAIRTAIREFLQREYNSNLKILNFTKSGNLEELTSSARNHKSTKKKKKGKRKK